MSLKLFGIVLATGSVAFVDEGLFEWLLWIKLVIRLLVLEQIPLSIEVGPVQNTILLLSNAVNTVKINSRFAIAE